MENSAANTHITDNGLGLGRSSGLASMRRRAEKTAGPQGRLPAWSCRSRARLRHDRISERGPLRRVPVTPAPTMMTFKVSPFTWY
jgi:hypothetical protein